MNQRPLWLSDFRQIEKKTVQTIILSLRGKWSEYGQIRGYAGALTRQQEKNIGSMKGICRAHMPFLFATYLDIQ